MRGVPLILRLFIVLGIPLAVATSVFFWIKWSFIDPMEPGAAQEISLMVPAGTSFYRVSEDLYSHQFVRYPFVPRIIAKLKDVDTRSIKAGEYSLSRGMTPSAIVEKFASGDIVKRRVTVTEGMTLRDIAKEVAAAGLIPENEFWMMVHDPVLLKKWGIPGISFEGYLYPETYLFSLPLKGEEIVATMIKEGERFWPEEYSNQAEKLGYTRHQILTLASIIEKESGDITEQPYVASVFHNRIGRGMKLQADASVIYGIPNFNGNLTKQDLLTPTPYNTYTSEGLPPGPIGNPGKNAINAALFPAVTQYLYFVADGTGRHKFSTELGDHSKAVDHLVELNKAEQRIAAPQPATVPPAQSLRPAPKAPLIQLGPKGK